MSANDKIKKFKKALRKEKHVIQAQVIDSWRLWVRSLPLKHRIKLAWKVIWRTL
jgi:hypothetical protein